MDKEYIMELLTGETFEYERDDFGDEVQYTFFPTNEHTIIVSFSNNAIFDEDNDDFTPTPGGDYTLTYSTNDEYNPDESTLSQDTTNIFKIFATLKKIVFEFVEDFHPTKISFTGFTDRQEDIYSSITPKLATAIGYRYTKSKTEDKNLFVLSKKK
jgi:hypothetical protein